jgi:hypothetical protein
MESKSGGNIYKMSAIVILCKQNVMKSLCIISKCRNFALESLRKATAVNINKVKMTIYEKD